MQQTSYSVDFLFCSLKSTHLLHPDGTLSVSLSFVVVSTNSLGPDNAIQLFELVQPSCLRLTYMTFTAEVRTQRFCSRLLDSAETSVSSPQKCSTFVGKSDIRGFKCKHRCDITSKTISLVLPLQPNYRSGHPENYLFVSSKNRLTGSKYSKMN